jgi:hypothetical protein
LLLGEVDGDFWLGRGKAMMCPRCVVDAIMPGLPLTDLRRATTVARTWTQGQTMIEINHPAIVAEVTAAVRRYEQALFDNDTATMNELFWSSLHTLRFGITENLYGHDAIASFRAARRPGNLRRDERRFVVTTFGADFATANVEYSLPDSGRIGRMSHTWVRCPEGWRIVAAHVSFLQDPG